MFGATDAYICRPFYYTGALLGLVAGAVALAVVGVALQPLNSAIADFARLYASEFRMAPLGGSETVGLLSISASLGLVGALLSVKRHLVRIS
jgi:cell division transport system permease protein